MPLTFSWMSISFKYYLLKLDFDVNMSGFELKHTSLLQLSYMQRNEWLVAVNRFLTRVSVITW